MNDRRTQEAENRQLTAIGIAGRQTLSMSVGKIRLAGFPLTARTRQGQHLRWLAKYLVLSIVGSQLAHYAMLLIAAVSVYYAIP